MRVAIDQEEFRLLRCEACEFVFKVPHIDMKLLLACYAKGEVPEWEVDGEGAIDRRFDEIRLTIDKYSAGRRILDVGCFAGDFLAFMGSAYERFGVEPNVDAAARLASRGIKLLGSTIAGVSEGAGVFDVIVALDVLEHIPFPNDFFDSASRLLAREGILIVMTGDTRSLAWRLEGSKYWYCSIPEHVAFYCETALNTAVTQHGLLPVSASRMSHNRTSVAQRVRQAGKNWTYIVGNRTHGLGLAGLQRLFVERHAPNWMGATDHVLYVARRPS